MSRSSTKFSSVFELLRGICMCFYSVTSEFYSFSMDSQRRKSGSEHSFKLLDDLARSKHSNELVSVFGFIDLETIWGFWIVNWTEKLTSQGLFVISTQGLIYSHAVNCITAIPADSKNFSFYKGLVLSCTACTWFVLPVDFGNLRGVF